jgi:hypothetical protein
MYPYFKQIFLLLFLAYFSFVIKEYVFEITILSVSVFLYLPFQLLNQMSDFHKILYEQYTLEDPPVLNYFIFYSQLQQYGGCLNLWGVSDT